MERRSPPTSGATRPPPEPLRPSDPLQLGRHRTIGRLGSGGMGVVYLAEGPLGPLAVKVVRSDLADDPEFRVRFQREIQSSFRLSGRATARLLDFDLTGERPWFATEFLDAPDVGMLVAAEGALDPRRQLAFAAGLVEGLVALHECEVVHRDLKPSNVLYTSEGPKLIDFGISAVIGSTRLTSAGQLLGTPAYMAPEQIDSGVTSAASDVFAWAGVVAFTASGRPAFGDGAPSAVALRVIQGRPDIDDALAPPLRGLVARALDKDPAARPSVHELQDALRVAATGALQAEGPVALPLAGATLPSPRSAARVPGDTDSAPTEAQSARPPRQPHHTLISDHPPPARSTRRPRGPLAWGVVALVAAVVAGVTAVLLVGGSDKAGGSGGALADVAFANDAVWFSAGSEIRRSGDGVRTLIDGGRPVALDSAPGSLFYVDAETNRVRSVGLTGRPGAADIALTDRAPVPGVGARHIVDASGEFVYVLDGGRVTRYALDGTDPVVVAGGGSGGDGPATSADLSRAVGVEAFVTNGVEEIYVLEPQALRRISQGRISTDRTFDHPTDGLGGFVLDPAGLVLLLLDRDNGQVLSIDERGASSVVAGAPRGSGNIDGTDARTVDLGELGGINYAPGGFLLVDRPQGQAARVLRVDRKAATVTRIATD